MKKLILSMAVMAAAFTVQAQKSASNPLQFGLGVDVSFPTAADDFNKSVGVGFGPKLQAVYKIDDMFSAYGQIGYNFFTKKTVGGISTSATTLPVMIGARVYPAPGLFVGAGLGFTSMWSKADYGTSGVDKANDNGFAYNPHLGYDGGGFEITLGYQGGAYKNDFDQKYDASALTIGGVIKF